MRRPARGLPLVLVTIAVVAVATRAARAAAGAQTKPSGSTASALAPSTTATSATTANATTGAGTHGWSRPPATDAELRLLGGAGSVTIAGRDVPVAALVAALSAPGPRRRLTLAD